MGTFQILPQLVVRGNNWELSGGALNDVSALSGNGNLLELGTGVQQAFCMGSPAVTGIPAPSYYTLDCSANTITLDGNPKLYGINDLPVGFNLTAMQLNIGLRLYTNGVAVGGHNCVTQFQGVYDQSVVYDNVNLTDGLTNTTVVGVISLIGKTYIDLFGDHWGMQITFTAKNQANTACGFIPYNGAQTSFKLLSVTGSYSILSGSYTLSSPNSPSNDNVTHVKVGDKIVIQGPNKLSGATQINIYYRDPKTNQLTVVSIPRSAFLLQTDIEIDFIFFVLQFDPLFQGSALVSMIGDGIQFSGEVVLGNITIYIADASGIYELVDGASFDTLYGILGDRSITTNNVINQMPLDDESFDIPMLAPNLPNAVTPSNYFLIPDDMLIWDDEEMLDEQTIITFFSIVIVAVTANVAIPNPFAKTGFLP